MSRSRHGFRLLCFFLTSPSPTGSAVVRHLASAAGSLDPAVSYLVACCGISETAAARAAASQKLRIASPKKADAVLRLLSSRGFSEAHIARLIRQQPRLLIYHAENRLKPKLDFLQTLGVGPNVISGSGCLLTHRIEKLLQPNLDSLSAAIGSTQAAAIALANCPRFLLYKFQERALPNLQAMQQIRVSTSSLHMVVKRYSRLLTQPLDQFSKKLAWLKEIGLKPQSNVFGHAIAVFASLSSELWDRKLKCYRNLGWTDEETLQTFKRDPSIMRYSEEKISVMAKFYAEELAWGKEVLMTNAALLGLSLEKRVKPRLLMLNILFSKGLLTRSLTRQDLLISEASFFIKYILKYGRKYPELLDAYGGKCGGTEANQLAEKSNKKKDGQA